MATLPLLQNAAISVKVGYNPETRILEEAFKITCKEGYVQRFTQRRTWFRTVCDNQGSMEYTIYDCVPKGKSDTFTIGSTNFKCKDYNNMVTSGRVVYAKDHVDEAKTCFDACINDSKCR